MTHLTDIVQGNMEKEIERLREDFEELFPKDQEARDGIRPSKSNRSAGLVLWAGWHALFKKSRLSLIQAMIDGVKAKKKYSKRSVTPPAGQRYMGVEKVEPYTETKRQYNAALQSILSDLEAAREEITKLR